MMPAFSVPTWPLDIPQSSDAFFEESNPDQKVNEIKTWLKSKGVHNFEQVALNTDSLSKARSLLLLLLFSELTLL